MSYGHNQFTPTDLSTKRVLLELSDEELVKACSTSKDMQRVCAHQDLWEERTAKYFPDYVTSKPKEFSWSVFYALLVIFDTEYEEWEDFISRLSKYIVTYAKNRENVYEAITTMIDILIAGKMSENTTEMYWESQLKSKKSILERSIARLLLSSDDNRLIKAGVKLIDRLAVNRPISHELVEIILNSAPLEDMKRLLITIKESGVNLSRPHIPANRSKERVFEILKAFDQLNYESLLSLLTTNQYSAVDFIYPLITPTEPSMFQLFIQESHYYSQDSVDLIWIYFSTRKLLNFHDFFNGLTNLKDLGTNRTQFNVRALAIFEVNGIFPTQAEIDKFRPLISRVGGAFETRLRIIIWRNNLPLTLSSE